MSQIAYLISHCLLMYFSLKKDRDGQKYQVHNLATKVEFHIKKSLASIKSQFYESKCADGGHLLNREFIVQ